MSVINRMEISNCINLDNYRPSQKDWSPHYPYLEINFRGAGVFDGAGTKAEVTHTY